MAESTRYDVAQLKRDHPIAEEAARQTTLIRQGDEYRGLCPFHAETTPSFTVIPAKGYAHCFGCGWNGDVIAFTADIHHVDFRHACEILAGASIAPAALPRPEASDERASGYDILRPVPASIDALPVAHEPLRCWNQKRDNWRGRWTTLRPAMVFPYLTPDGDVIGCVLRVDMVDADGKRRKWTPQMRLVALPDSGEITWAMMPFDRPRPIYGLAKLASWLGEVLWCEGEKAADAAQRILGTCAIATPGGGNSIAHADWAPLKGRSLLIWGDADAPGERAALGYVDARGKKHAGVAELALGAGALRVRYLPWDHARPEGWDAADAEAEGLTARHIHGLMRFAKSWTAADIIRLEKDDERDRDAATLGDRPDTPAGRRDGGAGTGGAPGARADDGPPPFRILGHNRNLFYYLPAGTQQIVTLTADQHTKTKLYHLASIDHWRQKFPHKSQDFHLGEAQSALFRAAEHIGFFELEALRGRGAWIDEGRPVVHYGPHVTVDGEQYPPIAVPSRFIYEGAAALQLGAAEPAPDDASQKLAQICALLSWDHPLSGVLFCGWLIVASVCGALDWRPHIWITGPPVSGKTTIVDHVIKPMLGALAIFRQGGTTEAHLRQTLFHDARPIVIDEAEREDKRAAVIMQNVLQLSRIASSGGSIGKGSADGHAIQYTVRSCFCFLSIHAAIDYYADETRIIKLLTAIPDRDDPKMRSRYRDLMDLIGRTISPDYCAAIFARTVANLPTLLANCDIFAKAAAATLKDPRAAQQIGTLMAGFHLTQTTARVTYDEAVRIITAKRWDEHTTIDTTADVRALLSRIALHPMRIIYEGKTSEHSIGDLILQCSHGPAGQGPVPFHVIKNVLGKFGILADDASYFTIANKSPHIAELLDGTPWSSDWRGALRVIPGAHRTDDPVYFATGLRERGMIIPLSILKGKNDG